MNTSSTSGWGSNVSFLEYSYKNKNFLLNCFQVKKNKIKNSKWVTRIFFRSPVFSLAVVQRMSGVHSSPCGQNPVLHVASLCGAVGLPCRGGRLPAGAAEHRSSQYGQTGRCPAQIQTSAQLIPAAVHTALAAGSHTHTVEEVCAWRTWLLHAAGRRIREWLCQRTRRLRSEWRRLRRKQKKTPIIDRFMEKMISRFIPDQNHH